jgi:hypothetical protein
MRGTGFFNAYAYKNKVEQSLRENLIWRATHKRLCWQCQQDRYTSGGTQRLSGPNMIFVCKECLESNKARKESK